MIAYTATYALGVLISIGVLAAGRAGGVIPYLACASVAGFAMGLFLRRRSLSVFGDAALGLVASMATNIIAFCALWFV